MRIGFFSDWHTSKNPSVDIIRELIELGVDIIINGGDWDVIPYSISELNSLREKVPIYSVYGNHDDPNILRSYGILIEDGDPIFDETTGLTICGFGGAIIRDSYSYPETWHQPEYYLEKSLEALGKLRENLKPCNILVFHDPPKSIVDEILLSISDTSYIDTKSYRIVFDTIIDLLQPDIVLSGHVHALPFFKTNYYSYSFDESKKTIPIINVISLLENTFVIIDLNKNKIEVYSYPEKRIKGSTFVSLQQEYYEVPLMWMLSQKLYKSLYFLIY